MPGFNIAPLGGGYSSSGPSNVVETRRKHRWVIEFLGRGNGQFSSAELLLLLSAARPSPKFEEVDMNHNQESAHFAGKLGWEPITLVWYDAEQDPDISKGLYHWFETVNNMHSMAVAHPRYYKRTGGLAMLDGTGQTNQNWTLYGTWPTGFNWQDLDMASNDIALCEVILRFDRAVMANVNGACSTPVPPVPIAPNCPV